MSYQDDDVQNGSDEFIPMAESTEINYRTYLSEFNEKVVPIFAHYGYSKDTALLLWTLDKIRCSIEAVEERLTDEAA